MLSSHYAATRLLPQQYEGVRLPLLIADMIARPRQASRFRAYFHDDLFIFAAAAMARASR